MWGGIQGRKVLSGWWGMIGAETRMSTSPFPGPLKIEHTETDAVSSRSNGRPPTAAAVPKSAVSAPPPQPWVLWEAFAMTQSQIWMDR